MGTKNELLYLSQEETKRAGAGDMEMCLCDMEDVMRLVAEGDYVMGGPSGNQHGLKLYFPKESTFPYMPIAGPDRRFMTLVAYLGGRFHVCGMKWYGSNIANREKGLPRSVHLIALNDPETGSPLCMMAGNMISAMRTGAMAGVGAKYLAKKNAKTLALIGIGVIGRACGDAILKVCEGIKTVRIVNRTKARAERFAAEYEEKYGVKVTICTSAKEASEGSDIISYATSGLEKPELRREWLDKGALVVLSADCRVDSECFLQSRIVVDNWKMMEVQAQDHRTAWTGYDEGETDVVKELVNRVQEGSLQSENILELGPIVAGNEKGRWQKEENILLVLDGMGVEDVALAHTVYTNARRRGIGTVLPLW